MKTATRRAGRWAGVAVATGALLGGVAGPAAAASGCSQNICISTDVHHNPETNLGITLDIHLNGWYHVHVWGGNNDLNTPDQWMEAGRIYVANPRLQTPIYKGTTICAQPWRWNGSSWEGVFGLPCIVHK